MGVPLAARPARYRQFAARLRASRFKKELTVTALANQADVTVETLRRWESGQLTRAPRDAQVIAVAKALDVEPLWLLDGIPPPESA